MICILWIQIFFYLLFTLQEVSDMNSCFFGGGSILLPNCDLSVWSTIACDQFTSDDSYWAEVTAMAEGRPSAYHITLPEIYLKEGPASVEQRIA